MNILLTAFECNPLLGSEAGLGWSWVYSAIKTAEIEKIWVVTTPKNKSVNNKEDIDEFLKTKEDAWNKVEFIYIDIPFYKAKINNRIRYIFWQKKIIKTIRDICEKNRVDYIHHVTWASMTLPTYLYRVKNTKIIYGPVGGGERISNVIKLQLTFKEKIIEYIRNTMFDLSKFSYSGNRMKYAAHCILVTTPETLKGVPKRYHKKCKIQQSIGVYREDLTSIHIERKQKETFVILMAARLLNWKGIQIGIRAVQKLLDEGIDVQLNIVGSGKYERKLKEMAKAYSQIQFVGNVTHRKMNQQYDEADLFLNCSLHDSGGMVILEAMSRAVPVMYINCGGPGELAKGAGIPIQPKSVDEMVDDIYLEISRLIKKPEFLQECGEKGLNRVREKFLNEDKYNNLITFL